MKEHLFARICRVLGRFLLCVGSILLIGTIIMAITPNHLGQKTAEESTLSRQSIAIIMTNPDPNTDNIATKIGLTTLSSVIIVSVAFVFIFIMRRYNADIRNIIKKIADFIHVDIHLTELILTLAVWSLVVLLTIIFAPSFSIMAFNALAINELLFIFAWTAYGCVKYTV